jgi:hypothetical protein
MFALAWLIAITENPVLPFMTNHIGQSCVKFFHKESSRRNGIGVPAIRIRIRICIRIPQPYGLKATKALLAHFSHRNHTINGNKYTRPRGNFFNDFQTILYDCRDKLQVPLFTPCLAWINRSICPMETMVNEAVEIHKEPVNTSIGPPSLDEVRNSIQ